MPTQTKFYTVAEVAKILNVHRNTLQRYIRENQIEAIRCGQGARAPYRITDKALDEWARRNQA